MLGIALVRAGSHTVGTKAFPCLFVAYDSTSSALVFVLKLYPLERLPSCAHRASLHVSGIIHLLGKAS